MVIKYTWSMQYLFLMAVIMFALFRSASCQNVAINCVMCTQYSLSTSPTYLSYLKQRKRERYGERERKQFSRRHKQCFMNLLKTLFFCLVFFASVFCMSICQHFAAMHFTSELLKLAIGNSCQFCENKKKLSIAIPRYTHTHTLTHFFQFFKEAYSTPIRKSFRHRQKI